MAPVSLPPDRIGLTSAEAVERLVAAGPNRLPAPPEPSHLARFARQLVHFFALMLWAAAGLAWIAGLGVLAAAIAAVILLNALFAFMQERRADRAAAELRVLLSAAVAVRRDRTPCEVDVASVVPGDVLLLEAGDRVPADGTVLLAEGLRLDTSMLTGESGSVVVDAGDTVFAGTHLVEGDGEVHVEATGVQTRLAGIAELTTAATPDTPLTRELHRVVRTIATIAIGVGIGFFVLAWLLGHTLDEGLVFAIGVTVALVPEALLPTVTLSLAWGAQKMAARHVLVRHLEAVETLGSTTFICTDKTGTLTRNEMAVVELWTPDGFALVAGDGPAASAVLSDERVRRAAERLVAAATRSSTGPVVYAEGHPVSHGEPMDAAVYVLARSLGVHEAAVSSVPPVARFPFDPHRRRSSVVVDGEVIVKGAPETVLPLCGVDATTCSPVDAPARSLAAMAERGLRVLAVAGRPWDGEPPTAPADAEQGVELYGLLGFEDPPRSGAGDAVEACRRAGIAVAMLTGDHPTTARAIAAEIGLLGGNEVVVTGDDLPTDEALLGALLDRDGVVVARVTPEDKLRIAKALRARGHVVAMTGDGVNDAPALHEADIGVAMGRSGTDVAREAADLVLLDDDFASIVGGVEQGRSTFVNMRRFLTYHLTDNVAELTPFVVWALSGGRFPLALGVLQILALDLGTDTLSAVALGAEPPARDVLAGPPVSGRLLDRQVARRAFGLMGPVIAAATMAAFLLSLVAAGWRPGAAFPTGHDLAAASGAAFMTVVLAQTVNAFACRSATRTPHALGWLSNPLLVRAALIELAFSLVVLFVPAIADQLGHANPPLVGWIVAAASMPLVLVVDWADKRIRRRRWLPSSA